MTNTRKGILLARPNGCPDDVYQIMVDCWSFEDEDRPTPNRVREQLSAIDMDSLRRQYIELPVVVPPKKPSRPDAGAAARESNASARATAAAQVRENPYDIAPAKPSMSKQGDDDDDDDAVWKAKLAAPAAAKAGAAPKKPSLPPVQTVASHALTPPSSPTTQRTAARAEEDERATTPITELMRQESDNEDNEDVDIVAKPSAARLVPPQPDDDEHEDMYVNENKANMPAESGWELTCFVLPEITTSHSPG